jgi:hypothetical protein
MTFAPDCSPEVAQLHTAPPAMPTREKPNNPVSPDFRPGLLVVDDATV